eukprot:9480770-Pyramimonas_sp.AAC.1
MDGRRTATKRDKGASKRGILKKKDEEGKDEDEEKRTSRGRRTQSPFSLLLLHPHVAVQVGLRPACAVVNYTPK